MATIAIVKVRSAHDVLWRMAPWAEPLLRITGMEKLRQRLRASDGRPFMSQLTLPYLAALGERHNQTRGTKHRFVLLDEPEELIEARLPPGVDLVLFTANTPATPVTYRVSDRLRAAGIRTAIGGIHASVLPGEAARHADAVVVGEAEGAALSNLLDDLEGRGELASRYLGGRIPSLAGLPVPRWQDAAGGVDLCPWLVPVQTSRGCRNACSFCSTTGFQGANRRHRPVEDVVAEIRQLQGQGVLTREKTIFFTDNNIVSDSDHRRGVVDKTYARSLFEALIPLNVDWVGQGEIGLADDPELLELAVRSGCHMLLIGFESLVQSNLGAVGKPCNRVEEYARQIEQLHRHGIALIGCFIFGMDHDTPRTFETSLPFIDRYIDIPQLSVMTPFPGTQLYRRLQREGRIIDRDWSRYDITHVVFRPVAMSVQELEHGYRWINERLFSSQAILRRSLRYTLTRTVPGLNPLARRSRFSSVLSTNLVYRQLGQIGIRDQGRQEHPSGGEEQRASEEAAVEELLRAAD
ncbi:MAG: B12-binding domain-containing radical SAM protein [Deltaproteobacteria bacterium]|nr:B12-binding domain-containing radical SAM protein [Deltaproteobacteria bacterium]